jgi:integrase
LAEINAIDPECHDFYRLIVLAGFRFDELCELNFTKEDLDAKQVTAVDLVGESRVVVLGSQACEVLQRVLERGGWTHGKTRLRKTVEHIAKRLRIDGVSCHTLRATCAAHMMAAGHSINNIMQNLGYRTDTTLRIIKRTADSERYAGLI